MPVLTPKTNDPIIESHEDRIGRLEDGISRVSTQLATNTERLDSLGEKLELAIERISETVSAGFVTIGQTISSHALEDKESRNRVEKLSERFERVDHRVDRIEEKAVISKRRWDTAKKVLLPILLAGLGVVTEHFVVGWFN